MKSIINDPWAKPLEVGDTGQKLLLNMYGGTGNDNLITKKVCFGVKLQILEKLTLKLIQL